MPVSVKFVSLMQQTSVSSLNALVEKTPQLRYGDDATNCMNPSQIPYGPLIAPHKRHPKEDLR